MLVLWGVFVSVIVGPIGEGSGVKEKVGIGVGGIVGEGSGVRERVGIGVGGIGVGGTELDVPHPTRNIMTNPSAVICCACL